jgi:hypothetical protein
MGFYKNILEDLKYIQLEKVKSFINEHLVFFFKKGDELFGCPEESRLVFAKMKNPDDEDSKGWSDEAAFLAFNLSKALEEDNEAPKRLFYKKDMDDLQILDKETLEKALNGKK